MTLLMLVVSMAVVAQNRPKIGLVLGGGGAKGAAEVGVLKVIEEAGVPIDYIAGTSIGSIVGGLYSVGYRSADIEKMFTSQQWKSLLTDRNDSLSHKLFARDSLGVRYVLGFPVRRHGTVEEDTLQGVFKGKKILVLLDSMVRTSPVATSQGGISRIPFRCVAADVAHGQFREIVLNPDSDALAVIMRSSMAIPGVFKPMALNGNVLIDGGALNNLPVDVCRQMGADIVIAIDLQQNKHDDYKSPLRFLKGNSGASSWLRDRPDIAKYNEMRTQADIYINPDLGKYDVMSFKEKAITDMIAMGEESARKYYAELVEVAKKASGGKKAVMHRRGRRR